MTEFTMDRLRENLESLKMKNTLEILDNYLERAVAENLNIVDVLEDALITIHLSTLEAPGTMGKACCLSLPATEEELDMAKGRLGVDHFTEAAIDRIEFGKMSSEQIATIYGAFAQMESTGHSSNMRLSVRIRMEKGLYTPSSAPYGYRLNGRDLEVVPEEAEVVRYIFSAYLSGHGQEDITRMLNQQGITRGRNRKSWYFQTVQGDRTRQLLRFSHTNSQLSEGIL